LPRSRRSLSGIAERADTALRKTNRRVLLGILLAALVAVVLSGLAFVEAVASARTTAQLVAGDTASTEVGHAGTSSLLVVRRDFTAINAARVAAGLAACPDPGPSANAYQVAWVAGECAGELRAFADLAKRGRPVPGVSAPDPDSGAFPSPAH
jgi:hypothetical protein